MIEPASFTVKLADIPIAISPLFSTTRDFCQDYFTDESPLFSVRTSLSDIDFERSKSAREDALEGIPTRHFSGEYLETLAVYRKIVERLLDYDILLFHGSCIAVDGAGYLFTAKSGTGKSTHTRLWRERFGARVVMVNDDKPLLKITDCGIIAYGTPWDGKHHLSHPISVPLKAICILTRNERNQIERITQQAAWPMLMQQSYRPSVPDKLMKTLSLVDRLGKRVELYRLGCNMEPDAAQVAYDGMKERKDSR